MKQYLTEIIGNALKALPYEHSLPLVFEKPKNEQHGDLTTNIAMLLAKLIKKNPRLVAQEIIEKAHIDPRSIVAVDIAGPGFINFKFSDSFFTNQIIEILHDPGSYGKSSLGSGKKTQVEFVSANPTGPLSVGHGRQAAIGDTISNLLQWTGFDVTREYYYNNAGRQMRVLAESTYARYRQLFDPGYPFPEDGYQGDYIREIAESVREKETDRLVSLPKEDALTCCKEHAEGRLFSSIKSVLARMGVIHDVFYNEDSLYSSGKIAEVIGEFQKLGLVYDQDGALWLKATAMGLEQDRVIVKSTGEPTYRLPDIAYHRDKFRRGFELIVDVFGADHIATIPDVPGRHQSARVRSRKGQSRYSSICNADEGWGTGKDVETSCKFCDTRRINRRGRFRCSSIFLSHAVDYKPSGVRPESCQRTIGKKSCVLSAVCACAYCEYSAFCREPWCVFFGECRFSIIKRRIGNCPCETSSRFS